MDLSSHLLIGDVFLVEYRIFQSDPLTPCLSLSLSIGKQWEIMKILREKQSMEIKTW